ncbi:MAG: major facilitator superfamily transporter, MFS transporter, DHA1 family, tetracycline resistance protein [Candidatus Gottesmanbacteria bacterium GW2011_GWA2_43_14]|uniref:Major facilitator superfamily transporter, MFS transporter, DHA1 family, tetracycline resistance protein n=1 Tax=Candidatus Gottesmanbacteria bacterium GW2011_GWA2_43_14 TaxID=1618443 RepID=A0A0G1G8X9_9BACT|nr:MAG: major facilitator superfamily transporter, MFS transporter, DHA1 family, tetracycline resistance protein [Candidatus Gottesmanbacteria bacterium GW2011_GWA2_43_14]
MPSILKSSKFLIFLIVFVNFLGYGIVFPLLPLMTIKYGGSPLLSGVMIGAFSLAQVFSMPVMGRLSDRYGRKPLLLISLWGTVVSFLIMGLTHSLFFLLLARILDGASGGNLSIAQAYIADISEKKDRAAGMGTIAAGISLGFIFGPLWGGFLSKISYAFPFFAASIITLISILLTKVFLKESVSKKEIKYEKRHFRFLQFLPRLLKSGFMLLFILNLLIFWAQSGLYTIMTLFANDILRLSVLQVGGLFALSGIVSAGIQAFGVKPAVKFFGEKRLFRLSVVTASFGMIILAVTRNSLLFVIGTTVFALGNSYLLPLTQAFVSEKSAEHEQGGNMGLLQSFGSVGRIFGPIAAGYAYQTMGPWSPALMGALIFLAVLILGLRI